MADLIGLLRVGAPSPLFASAGPPAPPKPSSAVVAVEAASGSSNSGRATNQFLAFKAPAGQSATGKQRSGQPDPGAVAVLKPRLPVDPDMLTGPPPSFSASLLELQSDLRVTLARIEAGRHIGHEDATRINGPAARTETPPTRRDGAQAAADGAFAGSGLQTRTEGVRAGTLDPSARTEAARVGTADPSVRTEAARVGTADPSARTEAARVGTADPSARIEGGRTAPAEPSIRTEGARDRAQPAPQQDTANGLSRPASPPQTHDADKTARR